MARYRNTNGSDSSPGTLSTPLRRRVRIAQMGGVVDLKNLDAAARDVEFVDRAGRLGNFPIARQRTVQRLQQYRAVHALMSDQNDGFAGMTADDEAEQVRRPEQQ